MHNELMHYGVLGMKWGVRKDGAPQGTEGWTRSTDANGPARGGSGNANSSRKGLSTGQKVAIGVGAAALAGTAAVLIARHNKVKLRELAKSRHLIARGKTALGGNMASYMKTTKYNPEKTIVRGYKAGFKRSYLDSKQPAGSSSVRRVYDLATGSRATYSRPIPFGSGRVLTEEYSNLRRRRR